MTWQQLSLDRTVWKQTFSPQEKLRLAVLEREKYECQNCYLNFSVFDVHHMKYVREPDGRWCQLNEIEWLITLCRSCHQIIQGQMRKHMKHIEYLREKIR